MPQSTKVLGIDYGARRVGLALGETETKFAAAYRTIENTSHLINNLRDICRDESVEQIVVGLPRGLDGQETQQTAIARGFADSLDALGLPVALQDEAVTSELAASRGATKADIDAQAAAIILQDYLDAR